jgi:glycine betaine catabolism A
MARLEPALASSLPASRTLPAEAYTSPATFDWEVAHFFEGGWVCVGRVDELARAGDQKAFPIGDESVLVVRDAHGGLKAFHNTCRHRGHELLEPGATRNLRAIKCPYHAWAYGLDGALRGAPRFSDVPGFDKADYPLIETRVVEWRGWVFVNTSGDAASFDRGVGSLDELVAPWEPERLFVAASHEYVIRANWKTITENYHECYHCPQIHPELCAVSPPSSGSNYDLPGRWVGGSMELRDGAETMSLDGASGGRRLPGVDPRAVRYLGLLPNLLVSLHPDYVLTHRLTPLSPDRTGVECSWLMPSADIDPSYAVEFWDTTNRQDWAACESVQRGLSSPHFRPGPLAPNEDAVHRFVSMVARGYLA